MSEDVGVQAQNLPYPLLSDTDQLLRKSFGIKVRKAPHRVPHVGALGHFLSFSTCRVLCKSGYTEVPSESQDNQATRSSTRLCHVAARPHDLSNNFARPG